MGTRKIAGIIGAAVLLTAGLSQAGSAGHVEPLDGTSQVGDPAGETEMRPRSSLPRTGSTVPVPQGELSARGTTPSGGPWPPSQLTPAPVLPFNPNRPLMPVPSAPAPYSGGGRLGR
jgi:hypothetical protein